MDMPGVILPVQVLKILLPLKLTKISQTLELLKSGNRVPLEDGSFIYFQIQNLPRDKSQIDGFKIS